jgi:hypothetical protein
MCWNAEEFHAVRCGAHHVKHRPCSGATVSHGAVKYGDSDIWQAAAPRVVRSPGHDCLVSRAGCVSASGELRREPHKPGSRRSHRRGGDDADAAAHVCETVLLIWAPFCVPPRRLFGPRISCLPSLCLHMLCLQTATVSRFVRAVRRLVYCGEVVKLLPQCCCKCHCRTSLLTVSTPHAATSRTWHPTS